MKHLAPITPKEVRNLMAVGLKTDEELHPDFPATGGLPVPVLAELDARQVGDNGIRNRSDEARESTTTAGPALPAFSKKEPDSRGGQPNFLNLAHAFKVVEERILGPRK